MWYQYCFSLYFKLPCCVWLLLSLEIDFCCLHYVMTPVSVNNRRSTHCVFLVPHLKPEWLIWCWNWKRFYHLHSFNAQSFLLPFFFHFNINHLCTIIMAAECAGLLISSMLKWPNNSSTLTSVQKFLHIKKCGLVCSICEP